MRLPLWLHSDDGRTVTLAHCRNCGKVKATSDPCGFDHLAAVMEFAEAAAGDVPRPRLRIVNCDGRVHTDGTLRLIGDCDHSPQPSAKGS
jgi:hypothetical protein